MLEPASTQISGFIVNRYSPIGNSGEGEVSETGRSHQQADRSQNTEISSEKPLNPKKDTVQISAEAREVAELEMRDQEVRAHEAAHAAVGGAYAGSPSLTYERGPDGRSYATSGEVSIDLSPVSGDPLATLQKAEVIRAAALAPAQPSAQDMRVASRAATMAAQARADLATEVGSETGENSQVDESSPVKSLSDTIPTDDSSARNIITT